MLILVPRAKGSHKMTLASRQTLIDNMIDMLPQGLVHPGPDLRTIKLNIHSLANFVVGRLLNVARSNLTDSDTIQGRWSAESLKDMSDEELQVLVKHIKMVMRRITPVNYDYIVLPYFMKWGKNTSNEDTRDITLSIVPVP